MSSLKNGCKVSKPSKKSAFYRPWEDGKPYVGERPVRCRFNADCAAEFDHPDSLQNHIHNLHATNFIADSGMFGAAAGQRPELSLARTWSTHLAKPAAQAEGQQVTSTSQFSGPAQLQFVNEAPETPPFDEEMDQGVSSYPNATWTTQQADSQNPQSVVGLEGGLSIPLECFKCNVCSMFGFSLDEVEQHLSNGHLRPPYLCRECGKNFATRRLLAGHTITNHSQNTVTSCPKCHKYFANKLGMIQHLRSAHKKFTKFPF